MKKVLAVFTIIIVFMGSFSACSKTNNTNKVSNDVANNTNYNKTGLPIVNEKVTLTAVAARRDDVSEFEGMPFFDMVEEKTNVHIKWDCIPKESFEEKKNLMFASNELPDIFYSCLTWDDISKYCTNDYFVPLNDYIDGDSMYYKECIGVDKTLLNASKYNDGNIYALADFSYIPNGYSAPALYINKTWLNKINMEVPKTTDEFYEVLKAFKNAGDLNGNGQEDEVPMTFKFADNFKGLGALFGSFGYVHNNYSFIIDENNEPVYVPITDEYKEALKYFNKLYSEGLIDQEGFTHNNSVYCSKIRSNPSTAGVGIFFNLIWAFGERDEYDYEVMAPLIGPKGDQKWMINHKGNYSLGKPTVVVTTECKNPEIAFRWGDYLYEEDNLLQSLRGMYGVCIEKQEDGTIKYINSKEMQESTPQLYAQTMSPGVSGIIVKSKNIVSQFQEPGEVEKEELNKFYNNYDSQHQLPAMMYSKEENKLKVELGADIDEYVKQMATKFITVGNIDEQWDEYLNKLNKMNLDKYIELVNNKYEKYVTKLNQD